MRAVKVWVLLLLLSFSVSGWASEYDKLNRTPYPGEETWMKDLYGNPINPIDEQRKCEEQRGRIC